MKKRILGIDLGLKKTGLAISDELWIVAKPLDNLLPKNRNHDVDYILNLCREHNIGTVVIGYALLSESGDEGFMAKRAKGFAEALSKQAMKDNLELLIVLENEWGSSKQAVQRLLDSNVKKSKRAAKIDSEVARILVENYIADSYQN